MKWHPWKSWSRANLDPTDYAGALEGAAQAVAVVTFNTLPLEEKVAMMEEMTGKLVRKVRRKRVRRWLFKILTTVDANKLTHVKQCYICIYIIIELTIYTPRF